MRRIIRRDDMFARVGGDEFLLFLRVKDEQAAGAVAARLHRAMNGVRADDGARLRCSVGALAIPPGAMSIDDLIRRADHLMYRAKLRGACLELDIASDVAPIGPAARARRLPRPPAPASSARRGTTERRSGIASRLGRAPTR